ncbi:hypothetical protein CCR75_007286 [Bremia lactucae]|uniref:Uncharacterized protein n=1 Tax=Bremia lactucae TaxID=4779 RepID=A0A976IH50_BRELC|nr:hypothetical protein CCR75_007286 [Bremia lactucae]
MHFLACVVGTASLVAAVSAVQPSIKYYVHVVADGEDCDYLDDVLPMCASKNFVCRMGPGHEMFAEAPSCIAYDPNNTADNPFLIEESASAPWGVCNPVAELKRRIGDPPVCKRDFTCQCLQGASSSCICAPPDAVDDVNGAARCENETLACAEDKYCHYLKEGGMECGQKPFNS